MQTLSSRRSAGNVGKEAFSRSFHSRGLNVGSLDTAQWIGGSEKSLLLSASQASAELSCLGQDFQLKLT